MGDRKFKRVRNTVRGVIDVMGIVEGKMDWLISLDDKDKLYSVRGTNEYSHDVSNVWDNEKSEFLLKEFMPIVNQGEPVIIFGSDGELVKVGCS